MRYAHTCLRLKARLEQLAGLIEQRRLRAIVESKFALAEIVNAVAYVQTGRAEGKVVVTMK